MFFRECFKQVLARFREFDNDLTFVGFARPAVHHVAFFHAVDQLHRTVVSELQPVGKIADGGSVTVAVEPFYRKQQLMVLRLKTGFPSGSFAKMHKETDLIAEFGERLILMFLHAQLYRRTIY